MKNYLFISLFLLFHYLGLFSQEKTATKQATFEVKKNALVEAECKYGNIHVETWDKTNAHVVVTIKAVGSNTEDLERLLKKIEINIAGNADKVSVKTNLDEIVEWYNRGNSLGIRFKDGTRVRLQDLDINFNLSIPHTNNVYLVNKYGDIYLGNLTGNANASLKYGNFKFQQIKGFLNLDLGYATGSVVGIGRSIVNMKYSNLTLGNGVSLRLTSQYSELDAGNLDTLLSESKYNSSQINGVDVLGLTDSYTDVNIGRLSGLAKVVLKYGNFSIDNVTRECDALSLEGSYTDIHIDIADDLQCSLDLYARYADLNYPSNLKIKHRETDNFTKKVQGTIGNTPTAKITISSNYGGVTIK